MELQARRAGLIGVFGFSADGDGSLRGGLGRSIGFHPGKYETAGRDAHPAQSAHHAIRVDDRLPGRPSFDGFSATVDQAPIILKSHPDRS